MLDWLGQSVHVALLPLLVLTPVGFLLHGLKDDLFPNDAGLRFLVLALPALWLLFPVALLSSLASLSRWNILRPFILARLLKVFPATVLFYLLAAVLAALSAAAWYATLSRLHGLWLLPVAAFVTAVAWFLYARLLGRLAWLLGQLGPIEQRVEAIDDIARTPKKRKRPRRKTIVTDPWAVPEEEPRGDGVGRPGKLRSVRRGGGQTAVAEGDGRRPVRTARQAATRSGARNARRRRRRGNYRCSVRCYAACPPSRGAAKRGRRCCGCRSVCSSWAAPLQGRWVLTHRDRSRRLRIY